MTEIVRPDQAVSALRDDRWVRVREGERELVVGTPQALARSRAAVAWAVAPTAGAGGAGLALLLVQWAVPAAIGLLVLAVLLGVNRVRVEVRARATYAQRERNERGRAASLVRGEAEEVEELPVATPSPATGWASVSRQQAALPARDWSLPHTTRRALS